MNRAQAKYARQNRRSIIRAKQQCVALGGKGKACSPSQPISVPTNTGIHKTPWPPHVTLNGLHFSAIPSSLGASHTSSMVEHASVSPSSNIAMARSVFNKITETVDNFKLHASPLLSLSEQWKGVRNSLAVIIASMESRAKKLETDMKRIESMLREIRVREEKLKVDEWNLSEKAKKMEVNNKEIEERMIELRKQEGEYEERFKILEFDEKFVDDALDVKVKGIRKLGEALELRKSGLSEELLGFEVRKREIEEECRCLEAKEKEIREEIEALELKRRGMVEEFRELEERERRVEESRRGLEAREKEIEDRSRVQELRGKEMKELGEELEMRTKEIVEGRRVLEEKRKGVDGTSQGLEGREKELIERSKEADLREKKIKARENDLNLKEKELIDLGIKLEVKEKGIDKGFQACCDELSLKKDQLVESNKALEVKESEIVEKCKEVELKQERMNEQWRVLEVKEKEISCRLRAVELKEMEMNDKRVMLVNEGLVGEPLNMLEFEEEQVSGTCRGTNLKAVLIKKCSNLFKQQYSEGKIVEDGCNVAGLKEVISENPQAENLAVTSVDVLSLFAEIQLVFKNDDARATASYLTEYAETVSMWQQNRLALKEEILGLLESLTAEHKHLQAAMCTCVFEMKDVYPPDFLLEAHLEHVRQKAKEMVQKGGGTAQDDAANMELGALRNVLQCTSNFKLESIYPPAPCELRITQLEKEMEVRRKPTKFLLKKKSSCDLGTKLEASESTKQTKTSPAPNLSGAISDSQLKKKRKASSSSSIKQNKRNRYRL
ncbi:uncharacterized protein LOC141647286 [Silene latifolia]|uniref:uncharacterized protein LOC141647286 n=1 Tax=Silene latifolia TaxID=37657 RepID=UPI003D76F0D1